MPACKVCVAIDSVSDVDRDAIIKYLDDPDITNVAMASVLTKNGYALTETTVRRHKQHEDNNVNR